ncbi:MAG: serine hydrolase [bacterium]|nr:serine hydrolase [bacterium]
MKRYSLLISLSIILFGVVLISNPADAFIEPQVITFTTEAIERGYTVNYNQTTHPEWGDFRVGILPNLVSEEITVETKQFDDNLPNPPGLKRVSDYYIYDILRVDPNNQTPLYLNKPFAIALKFNGISNYYRKRIYYWSGDYNIGWVPLPSSADYDNEYIRAFTHLPFSRVAVFEDSAEIDNYGLEGKASFLTWNRYPDGVASNDYPIGTKLRVKNVDNGKIVDVTVQSTGPFADFNQRRIIDLSRTAFSQIEDTWKGLVRVQVWPIGDGVKVLGVDTYSFDENKSSGSNERVSSAPEPHPNSTAVIAISEKTGEILYSKNYDTVLPIASLTKLMTASVFLDTNTPFDKVITYTADDNTVGSTLQVNAGETMIVRDLYYSMLVGSANNAANALARSTGLSREEFVSRMNEKARAWGLTHTKFVDVSGLDTNNVSTVYEVALMSKNILNDFRILQGTTTREYGFRTINTNIPHTIKSSAKGVTDGTINSSWVITGMKTGYLDEAGYCFMLKASTSRERGYVITVVLGAGSTNQRYNETNDLINYGLSKL